jgi:hypothetical protein
MWVQGPPKSAASMVRNRLEDSPTYRVADRSPFPCACKLALAALCAFALMLVAHPIYGQPATPIPTPGGHCCAAHSGPSCDSLTCISCVCGADTFCCDTVWDTLCAEAALGTCAASCGCATPTATDTPAPTPTPGGDCCAPHGGASCNGGSCSTCVCGIDGFCCNTAWDEICVSEAQGLCAASCTCSAPTPTATITPPTVAIATPTATSTPGGDCCNSHAGPSCDSASCQNCVCSGDPFCCDASWDALCSEEAATGCGAACGCAVPPTPTPVPTNTGVPASPSGTPTPGGGLL